MASLLKRALRGRKGIGFSEPPFWALDRFRFSLNGSLPDRERIENDFEGYVQAVYKADGVVFACAVARMMVFSEARFQWREFRSGRPGDLFGTDELALLENPWPNGTTGDLLARMETDVTLAGNFYATVADDAGRVGRAARGPGRRLVRMRPDWVTIVIGSRSGDPNALDARVVAYDYAPQLNSVADGGIPEPVTLLPSEVCHYAPIPDPEAKYRGMSWLTPVLREVAGDKAATKHKLAFFENAATPQLAVRVDASVKPEVFRRFMAMMEEQHAGAKNAYKTLYLGGGADVTPLTMDMRQLDFKATQGAGETRIAAAARVHPVIVGLSEGLAGSSLNAGNFGQARRNFVDGTMRPLWRTAAASLQTLVTPPRENVALWYDDRDIAFLREDRRDVAEIQQAQSVTIRNLVDAGYEPETVIRAVQSEDWSLLRHTGLFSVQLQPPGMVAADAAGAPALADQGQ